MTDLDDLKTTLKGTFDVTMVQQGAYSLGLKDEKTAGGVTGSKSGGYNLGTRAVDSREDLCDTVLSSRELMIYSFGGGESGHSVAFDSSAAFYFFDPNFGIFFYGNITNPASLAWFRDFWEYPCFPGGDSYKTKFHKGRRHLIRFGQSGVRWQLNPAFAEPWISNPLYTG
jgi:hypothetical protein